MKISRWSRMAQKALKFINVHLFLTLISLPILVSWGLPISLASPFGNLFFNPILTAFLLVSSFIFFTELFSIPNSLLIWVLEKITSVWNYTLQYYSPSVLRAFKIPPIWLLLAIPFCSFAMLLHPTMRSERNRTIGLSILFVISWLALLFVSPLPKTVISSIPCNNGNVSIIHHNGKTILIDPGVIGQRISAPSWISYTLIPEIAKMTGSLIIDYAIITKPGIITFEAIETLCKKITVKKLYLPYLEGELDQYLKKKFYRLYAFLKSTDVELIRTGNKKLQILLDERLKIQILPEQEKSYRTIRYWQPTITACIDNNPLNLYDSKK